MEEHEPGYEAWVMQEQERSLRELVRANEPAIRAYLEEPTRPTREELAHEVERLRGLMEAQDRRIIRLTAELNMHARPKGFVNAKKRRRMEARAVKHAIVEVMR